MADIKVKTTIKKTPSVTKTVKVNKIKASEKPSVAEDDFMYEEDEVSSDEAECLLRSALNIKKNCCVQEDEDQESNEDTECFQPIDQLISSEIHHRISSLEKTGNGLEEDNQDYVVIGCRFPNGVVISLGKNKLLLRGVNDMSAQEKEVYYQNVGFTKMIRPVWNNFLKTHKNWPPILNGSIFVVNNKE